MELGALIAAALDFLNTPHWLDSFRSSASAVRVQSCSNKPRRPCGASTRDDADVIAPPCGRHRFGLVTIRSLKQNAATKSAVIWRRVLPARNFSHDLEQAAGMRA
jgi:hypothetical protein